MALAIASVATTAYAELATVPAVVTVAKPSGLAEGDLMVAIVGSTSLDISAHDGPFDGFTLKSEIVGNNANAVAILTKTATAGDVLETDFTFTANASNRSGIIGGIILRITGTQPVFYTSSNVRDTDGGTTNNYTPGITPIIANSILIMAVASNQASTATTSGYAITTSDPTWTERLDTTLDPGTAGTFAVATGPRAEVTATGDFLAIFSGTVTSSSAILASIVEATSVTPTPAVVTMTVSVQAPAISTIGFPAVITMTVSVQAPSVTAGAGDWSNQSKSSNTWTNQPKS